MTNLSLRIDLREFGMTNTSSIATSYDKHTVSRRNFCLGNASFKFLSAKGNAISSLKYFCSLQESKVDLQTLTPKERRQLRAARRKEKLGVSGPELQKMEALEEPVSRPEKTIPVSKSEFFELEHLRRLGDQWYMLYVANTRQDDTLEKINLMMAENFPDTPYELFFPTYPEGRKSSPNIIQVEPEGIFVYVTMTENIAKALNRIARVKEIFGRKHKRGKTDIIIPTPVPETSIMDLRRVVEAGHKKFRDSAEQQAPPKPKTIESLLAEKKPLRKESIRKHLVKGTQVRVIQGPYRNVRAEVVELVPRKKKVIASINLLGTVTQVEFNTDHVELIPMLSLADQFLDSEGPLDGPLVQRSGSRFRRRDEDDYDF